MEVYTKSCIEILNDTTKDLQNLNELGIYLSKQTDINALKVLKLMILASECKILSKPFDIDAIKESKEIFMGEEKKKVESIISNLSMNPQYFGLELMDLILQKYQININLQPYDSTLSIFDLWTRSFVTIESNQDRFYKRYDMTDKKMDMIEFMIQEEMLSKRQIEDVKLIFTQCIQGNYAYTSKQLLRMEHIVHWINKIDQLQKSLINLRNMNTLAIKNEDMQEIIKNLKAKNSNIKYLNMEDELQQYAMHNDQCVYMLKHIPTLIGNKTIK